MFFLLFPSGNKLSSVLPLLHPECHSLPEPNLLPGQLSHGAVGMHGGKVIWLSMAFESVSPFVFLLSLYVSKKLCDQPHLMSSLQRPHTRGNPPFRPIQTSFSGRTSSRSSLLASHRLRPSTEVSRRVSTGNRSSWKL